MPTLNTAVILWSWGQPVSLQDRSWHESYFFDPLHGQAAYWLKQTSSQICIAGQVFDWMFDPAAQRDFSSRRNTVNMAIAHMEAAQGVDFSRFDCVVVVLGIPKSTPSDGGSASGVKSDSRKHHGIVIRTGDPFDFLAHELGHALGLAHSFTFNTAFQAVGDAAGGYGHPHCIMSAMVYGGNQPQARHDAAQPLGLHREYQNIGPSLNGATALARGWIDAHAVTLTDGFETELEIRARQWFGRDANWPPQGIRLQGTDGSTYVVEFYESRDWDQGLHGDRLIITQDRGGLAEQHYPHAHSGTFLGSLSLPASLTGPAAALNVPGPIGLIPLLYDPVRHVLKVRIKRGVLTGGVISMTDSLSTQRSLRGTGSVVFGEGERFCVIGEWSYSEILNRQTVTIEATHPRAHEGTLVQWSLDGEPCPRPAGCVVLHKTVLIADPKMLNVLAERDVRVEYRIEAIPFGSKLILTNRPEDESYSISVVASFKTSVAAGARSEAIEFTGREYEFPQEFWDRFGECMGTFLKRKLKDSQTKVVFDPGEWGKIPSPLRPEVLHWLDGLGYALDANDRSGFDLAAAALRHRLKLPTLKLLSFDTKDAFGVDTIEQLIPPPGTLRAEGGSTAGASPARRGGRLATSWFALVVAAALGAAAAFTVSLLI